MSAWAVCDVVCECCNHEWLCILPDDVCVECLRCPACDTDAGGFARSYEPGNCPDVTNKQVLFYEGEEHGIEDDMDFLDELGDL